MQTIVLYGFALLCELAGLFAIWTLSIRRRIMASVMAAALLISLPPLAGLLHGTHLPAPAYVGFAGMYLLAGLAWRWWNDGVPPTHWRPGDVVVATLSTMLFAIAGATL